MSLAQDLIRDWDAHLAHERRRSEHTRRAYIATAERFAAFLSGHHGGAGEALALTGAVLPLGDVLRVTGKRNKTRVVPILPAVAKAVARYVDVCPWPMEKETPLFLGARGGPLQPGVVRASVRSARRALGLPERTTPHALRHSFATHLLAGGADLRSLQELLGHASLASTQVYTAVDAAHLLDIYRNAHPRA